MAKMQAARAASKLTFARRRAEKRQAAKVARATERAALKAEQKARKAAERIAKAAKEAVRHPRGRPPKPKPRAARWTEWRPEFARRVYHAVKRGHVNPDTEDLAEFIGVTPRTIRNFRHRHPAFDRAIMRGYEDRVRLRGAILSCRRETVEAIDPAKPKFNYAAATERGLLANLRVKVEFDHERHEELLSGGHLTTHMRRRWHERPPPPAHLLAKATASQRQRYLRAMAKSPYVELALGVIEGGALSNRQIARGLYIGESTLRLWRRNDEALDRAIHDAVAAYRERLAEQEHDRAWQRVAWQVERGLTALAMEDAYERGLTR